MAASQQLSTQEPARNASIAEQIREAAREYEPHICRCSPAQPCRPEDLAKLAAKLCKVMAACAIVPKDKQNPQQHYKYASSDAVLEKANPAFVAAGLATVYEIEVLDRQLRTTTSGAIWELVTARARLTIVDSETGATLQTDGIGQGYDSSDKAFSKAQTQARKYALLLALNISTGDDPEADDRSEKAQIPSIPCRKCKGPAAFVKDDDFDGRPVKIYFCENCRTETRRAA
jgi:hypothetical protein